MRRTLIVLAASAILPAALAAPPAPAGPQDSKSWLEAQGWKPPRARNSRTSRPSSPA